MYIIITRHAQEAMIDRGVTYEMVERTIKMGNKIKQTNGFLALYGYVRVAYRMEGKAYVVKTVMVDGGI